MPRTILLRALAMTASLLLAACGGGGGDTPAGPAPGLSLSSSGAVTVPSGGDATSTITITRIGSFQGTVTLAVSGQPASVSASIAPQTLSSGTTSATITWTAVAGAAAGGHTVTVQATGSGVPTASTTIPLSIATQPPAAIAILAGDNQTIVSGDAVPVLPRVVVRDALGRPVAGVTVTFSRDSGGSQLTDTIRVTGTDGIAQIGAWRPAPGRNVIRAVAGTLAPVFFRAEGTGALTIGDQTIPVTGGTITVSRPGDPLNGLQITVPAQAYAEPMRAVVQYGTAAPVPGRAGTRAVTPPITLSANRAGIAKSPLTLRIPAKVSRTEVPVAVVKNLTTGEFMTVPAVAIDTQTVMVILETFDGSLIGPPPASALRARMGKGTTAARSARDPLDDLQPYFLQAIIGAVPYAELTKELDTQYRPAVDNWEFDQLISRLRPWDRYNNGLPMLAAWYFDHFKTSNGALRGRFQQSPGVEISNVQGLRMADQIEPSKSSDALATYNASLIALAAMAKIPEDSVRLLLIKTALHQTGRPQILQGNTRDANLFFTQVLVYRANGNVLDVTFGTSQGGVAQSSTITYANGALSPLTIAVRDIESDEQRSATIADYDLYGLGGYSAAELNGLWQQALAGKVGEGQYPSWNFATKDQPRITDDTIWIAEDSVRFWVECKCELDGWDPDPGVTPTDKIGSALVFTKSGSTFVPTDKEIRGKGVKVSEDKDGNQYGFAITERIPLYSSSFVDWTVAVVKVRRLTVTPAASTKSADSPFTLTADIARSVPAGATYEWELGDGRTVTTGTNTAQVQYPPPTTGDKATYTIKARIKKDGKTWASGKTTVTIESTPAPYWKMTTFVDVDDLVDPPGEDAGQGGPLFDLLWGAESVPGSALIAVSENQLTMRVKRTGVWSTCCPPPFGGDDYVWVWSTWSQSSTDLATGTMSGNKTEGASEFRFEATRNGKTMTGTMTLKVSVIDPDTGQPDVSIYRFNFTAERMR